MWFIPEAGLFSQSLVSREACGLVTGNFHFRCEPELSSVRVGAENFHEYSVISMNEKFKLI